VDVQNLPLANVVDMIRGAAGTPVQLQVVAADAPPNSLPRIVTIYRDQIKFKR
jgi:C-terminal processing protease CtpA/Prc